MKMLCEWLHKTDGFYELIEVKGDNTIDNTVVRAKNEDAEEITVLSGIRYLMYAGSVLMKSIVLEANVETQPISQFDAYHE